MTEPVVLIPPAHADLAAALAHARPGLAIGVLGRDPPDPARALLIFVDWLLPEMSGLEMCRRLRADAATQEAHIVLVLESADPDAMRRALRAGADDYLVGPLDGEHLLAAVTRQLPAAPDRHDGAIERLGALAIDRSARQVRWHGRPIPLRPAEFDLLAHFVTHPDRVFSRTALIDEVGKDARRLDPRTVDVWIGRLRRALTQHGVPDPLRTVRPLGYVFDSPAL
jgi:two-component system phosphate regulon response regulator PhoB